MKNRVHANLIDSGQASFNLNIQKLENKMKDINNCMVTHLFNGVTPFVDKDVIMADDDELLTNK